MLLIQRHGLSAWQRRHCIIGHHRAAAQATTYANTWLSFPSDNTTMGALVSGLRNTDVPTKPRRTGPFFTLKEDQRRIGGQARHP